jgi:hypothetical protein
MKIVRPVIQAFLAGCALFALIAISANSAGAEGGAKWQVVNAKGELVEVKSKLSPSLTVLEVENKSLKLLTRIFEIPVTVSCTGAQLLNAKLEEEGKVSAGTQLKLTGCQFNMGGVECTPVYESESGVILSQPLKGLLALHEGAGILRIEPVEKLVFAVITLNKECGLKEFTIGNVLTLKDSELKTELERHLFVEGPLTEMWAVSKAPNHTVQLDGSIVLGLGGEHKALKWSGTPG